MSIKIVTYREKTANTMDMTESRLLFDTLVATGYDQSHLNTKHACCADALNR